MDENDAGDARDGEARVLSRLPADAAAPRMVVTARLGALSGVAFFVLLIAALLIASSTLTTSDVPGDVAARDWSDRHDQLKLRVALLEAAASFGLVFAVELKVRIERWGAIREALLALSPRGRHHPHPQRHLGGANSSRTTHP